LHETLFEIREKRMDTRRSVLAHLVTLLATLSLPRNVSAQVYPARVIKIIVPFPPGGPGDIAMRIVQAGLETTLGQPIVVENVPGAGGALGAARVKQAEPDGYMLVQVANPHTTNAVTKPTANIDLLRDFAPIGDTGESTYTLCASKELSVTTLAELIAKAKSKPGELKIGHVGVGSVHHLINELLKSAAGIDLSNVPYRGETQASVDLVAGRIDLMFLVTAKQLLNENRVVALGHTSSGPWFNLPGVKPLHELGLKDFVVPGWNGIMAPKNTPPGIVDKLSAALSQLLKTEQAKKGFNAIGLNPGTGSPQRLTELIENDTRRFTAVIRDRNLKFEL
jgi:tripartite-type tricarboxylate transporter receptor subunit TctC